MNNIGKYEFYFKYLIRRANRKKSQWLILESSVGVLKLVNRKQNWLRTSYVRSYPSRIFPIKIFLVQFSDSLSFLVHNHSKFWNCTKVSSIWWIIFNVNIFTKSTIFWKIIVTWLSSVSSKAKLIWIQKWIGFFFFCFRCNTDKSQFNRRCLKSKSEDWCWCPLTTFSNHVLEDNGWNEIFRFND